MPTRPSDSQSIHEIGVLLPELLKGVNEQKASIAHLNAQQEKTSTILDHIWKDLKVQADRLATTETQLAKYATTKWDNIYQAAAVACTVGGFLWFIMATQIGDVKNMVEAHANLEGHPYSVIEKTKANQSYMERLEEITDRRFDRLDERLRYIERSFGEQINKDDDF